MRLLITQNFFETRNGGEDRLETAYYRLFEKLDTRITLIPLSNQPSLDLKTIITELAIDGLILSGGNDVVYDDSVSDRPSSFSIERNGVERKLLEQGLRLDLPVFGICRGLQMISRFFGATLIRLPKGESRHLIQIDNQLVPQTINQSQSVNSYHDFGVPLTEAPAPIRALARDPTNNTIEALGINGHKITATQWHPERETIISPLDRWLLNQFLSNHRWQ